MRRQCVAAATTIALGFSLLATPPAQTAESSQSSAALRTYYLYDLPIVQTTGCCWGPGSLEINGQLYDRSVIAEIYYEAETAEGQYNLKRRCRTLVFTAGIADDQDSDSAARFRVYKGDRRIANFVLELGESRHRKLKVRGALRVRLAITNLTDHFVRGGYGDARVRCRRL